MRKLIIILLLLFPFYLSAEETLVGENYEEDVVYLKDKIRQIDDDIKYLDLSKWSTTSGDTELSTADDIDFQQKQAKQLVIENRTSDPASPVTGEIWFRTDL